MSSDRRMTRRRMLGLAGVLSFGAAGAAALAACGETQVIEKIVTVEVERVVEKVVTVEVERIVKVPGEKTKVTKVPTVQPQPRVFRYPVEVDFATDHSVGTARRSLEVGNGAVCQEAAGHHRQTPSPFWHHAERAPSSAVRGVGATRDPARADRFFGLTRKGRVHGCDCVAAENGGRQGGLLLCSRFLYAKQH